ncbi:CBS domain-containing protein [Embleya sp. NPDC059213]|uniref:CBS domain-containing protein n=1 Tax=Embleya sp. NPDC059213 TaxID=3346771 RepID=UPI00368BA686
METWQVSALPVVDDGHRVLGIVSEGDLLPAYVAGSGVSRMRSGPDRHSDAASSDEEFTTRDLMTAPVITVTPPSGTLWAARLMDRHHVKRLPVVDRSGRLVGIVSRRDLLGALVRSDAEIRQRRGAAVRRRGRCRDGHSRSHPPARPRCHTATRERCGVK